MMLTVLLPECAPGVQLPPWILWQFTHAVACCKSIFGSAGTAVAVVLNWLVKDKKTACF
jgi:hypothetical protein